MTQPLPRRRTTAPTVFALVFVLALVALTGCSSGDPTPMPDPAAGLRGRPTLAEVTATYQHMLADLQNALTPILGADGWKTEPNDPPGASCQQFGPEQDTATSFLPSLTLPRFVPEPQWTQAIATIAGVTSRYRFSAPVRVIDRADEHRLILDDPYGAQLTIQDGPRFLDITLTTGCHLRNGAPSPQ